jgi:hypothetical protein
VFTFNVLLFVWGLLFHVVAFLATRAVHSKHALDLGPDGPLAQLSAKEGEGLLKDKASVSKWGSVKQVALSDAKRVSDARRDRWVELLRDASLSGPPAEKIGRLRNLYLYFHNTAARKVDTSKNKTWTKRIG